MASLSLARIMYGTSEDRHSSHSMNALSSALPPVGVASDPRASAGAAGPFTLGELLQKAWAFLTHKR
jgi:hypothetical protein